MPGTKRPRRIVPKFRSPRNLTRPIPLRRGALELSNGDDTVVGDAVARLIVAPRDRVLITATFEGPSSAYRIADAASEVTARFGESGQSFQALITRSTISNAKTEVDLVPKSEPIILTGKSDPELHSAIVHVLNFPQFLCLNAGYDHIVYRSKGSTRALSRVLLHHEGWEIELQELPETADITKNLKSAGGNAITHVARLAKEDNSPFSVAELHRMVLHLHRFLSFACGTWIPVFGTVGFDAGGETVLEEWGSLLSSPWQAPRGWFDIHRGQTLAELFPGFVGLMGDDNLKQAASAAIYWYLRSNRAGDGAGVDSGIILAHAALERLATAVIARDGLAKQGNAAAGIRAVFYHLGIPVEIPAKLSHLSDAQALGDFVDGPQALSRIRNELVHPKRRLKSKLAPLIVEGWSLGQWYCELMLLRLAGYEGLYSNRITAQWIGENELVPWVANKPNK